MIFLSCLCPLPQLSTPLFHQLIKEKNSTNSMLNMQKLRLCFQRPCSLHFTTLSHFYPKWNKVPCGFYPNDRKSTSKEKFIEVTHLRKSTSVYKGTLQTQWPTSLCFSSRKCFPGAWPMWSSQEPCRVSANAADFQGRRLKPRQNK